jgi:hypothetical protein
MRQISNIFIGDLLSNTQAKNRVMITAVNEGNPARFCSDCGHLVCPWTLSHTQASDLEPDSVLANRRAIRKFSTAQL